MKETNYLISLQHSVPFLRNFHWGAKEEKKAERKI
jgi:hypothetical protein